MAIRMAIAGFGKIAREQHRPAILASPDFDLIAVTSRSAVPDVGVPAFADLPALLTAMPGQIDAVAICTPPGVRHGIAREALAAGLDVLLEKPPAATLGQVADLVALAERNRCTLMAGWHSQFAPAVLPAAQLLAGAGISRLHIRWHEDVRKFHPGQDWVWEAGSLGVFDPGINALSIATAILPERLIVESARLHIPANRQAPITAELTFAGPAHSASFDWCHGAEECWRIAIETDAGRRIELHDGGARLLVDGQVQPIGPHAEYPALYARFGELVTARGSQIDMEPLRIVADAFLVGSHQAAPPFQWISPP